MGLDGVELIIAVEEKFDISIPDEVEGGIEAAGDLCELVVRIRRENPSASALENTDEYVWKK